MTSRGPAPVFIERTLLMAGEQPDSVTIEKLVSFQRGGRRLLLIAPRPKRWRPTLKSVDRDLAVQQVLHQRFTRAGAELDGVFYLSAGLFSRRSAMARELDGLARRYERELADITLIGQDTALLETYATAGGRAVSLTAKGPAEIRHAASLDAALQELQE